MSVDDSPGSDETDESEMDNHHRAGMGAQSLEANVVGFVLGLLTGVVIQFLLFVVFVPYVHRLPLGVPLVVILAPGLTCSISLIHLRRRTQRRPAMPDFRAIGTDAAVLGVAMSSLLVGICAGLSIP
jgi:multisubunit Na+/H+ antiporter MnhE subunit